MTDKQRLDFLSQNKIREFEGVLYVAYMPSYLENGQTIRQGIDVAVRDMRSTRTRRYRAKRKERENGIV